VAINPATPLEAVAEILPHLDLLLVMTVNPGFGGQSFIGGSVAKIERARAMLSAAGRAEAVDLQVDGGIDLGTARDAVRAGANVLVAGSAVFGDGGGGPAETIPSLRSAATAKDAGTRQ
jgi:ribulose-phosphate 3-epimerase